MSGFTIVRNCVCFGQLGRPRFRATRMNHLLSLPDPLFPRNNIWPALTGLPPLRAYWWGVLQSKCCLSTLCAFLRAWCRDALAGQRCSLLATLRDAAGSALHGDEMYHTSWLPLRPWTTSNWLRFSCVIDSSRQPSSPFPQPIRSITDHTTRASSPQHHPPLRPALSSLQHHGPGDAKVTTATGAC